MRNYLQERLYFLIGLSGGLVFCFGSVILASDIMLKKILIDTLFVDGKSITAQYWVGIPTILTGGILVLTVIIKKQTLKYISLCCVLITMVLTLGAIIVESPLGSYVRLQSYNPFCDRMFGMAECEKYKKADPWFYILSFLTDIVLVICSFVMLLLFAEWILFVAPELSRRGQPLPQVEEQPMNAQFHDVDDDIPLLTVA